MTESRVLFRNAQLIFPSGIQRGELLTEKGRIADISVNGSLEENGAQVIDAEGMYLSPGFIDVHTHGAGGADFMDGTLDAVRRACRMYRRHGTTSVLPTTLTSTTQSLMKFLDFFQTVPLKEEQMPEILGLHLEGPYFARSQRGAQDEKYLRNPEPWEYEEALRRSDRIRRWSFAVELPGARELMKTLNRQGVVTSLAHSEADCRQVMEAYDCGLRGLTHFYSCMSGVFRKNAYRRAGAVEAGYLLDDLFVEVIADGCHLPGELLQLIYKVKNSSRICLVTDSMRAAGMPEGVYQLGSQDEGQKCIVEDGVAKLPDRSAFAGSVATMDRLVRTFRRLTQAPLHEVVRMASLTPAELIGCGSRKGSLCIGKDADLLLFDENIQISLVMIRGNIVS